MAPGFGFCWFWDYAMFGAGWGCTALHILGVLLDSWLLFKKQMTVVAGIAFAQLCVVFQLCCTWKGGSAHALVTSWMYYCNLPYVGLPLKKLQPVQNAAVWAVIRSPIRAQITSLLCDLHWLSVCFWVQLKMLVFTFKALHVMGPGYLWNHCFLITSHHLIRSRQKRYVMGPIC